MIRALIAREASSAPLKRRSAALRAQQVDFDVSNQYSLILFAFSAGEYANETQSSACRKCPAGKFQSDTGKLECHDCPPGRISTVQGQQVNTHLQGGNANSCLAFASVGLRFLRLSIMSLSNAANVMIN